MKKSGDASAGLGEDGKDEEWPECSASSFDFNRPVGKQRTRSLAPKSATDELPVPANECINAFRNENDPRKPQHQGKGNEHRQTHRNESNGSCAPVDLLLGAHAMNGLIQLVGSQLRCKARDAAVRCWNQFEKVVPIQPTQDLHLKGAKRALAIVEHKMRRHTAYYNPSPRRIPAPLYAKKVRPIPAGNALCFSPS